MLGSVITAMVTPFRADGAVDFERFRELATYLVENGSDGLVVCGTTGESPTLSDAEKLDLFRVAVDEVGGRATVIAGTGTYDTGHSAALTKEATKLGVDAILVVTPYYNKPPQRAIVRHFEEIAGATHLPVVAYNIPGRVVINIESETIARLAEIENVVAVKQAHDDREQARFIAEETRLDLYSGDDPNTFAFLELGGVGVVSVTAHLWGPQIAEMIRRPPRRRRRGRAGAARGAAAGLRPPADPDEPDPDQGGAQPHGPRGRRTPAADGRAGRERARADPLLSRAVGASRSRVGVAALDSAPMGECRIIPLGGLGEVGKNMTVYEADGAIVVVDAGLAFPRDEHLGVDLVLPDFSYLRDREQMVRAVVLTHGHEDHVGALPYLMREVRVPLVLATRLTLALVKSKLDEHGLLRSAELRELAPGDEPVELGPFRLEFIRMAHSIPDAAAVMLETPGGRCVHTGDYKLDHTPVDGQRTDVGRLAEIGSRGVDLLLGDSTNAERAGVTESERVVGEAFRQIFPSREGRILVSSFASNVHRMQQAADVGVDCGRKVAFVGRSMRKNANIARSLGYMDVPEEAILRPHELAELPRGEQLILCTGSQGEPMSAMTRIAYNDHPAVSVEAGDTVIISAKPIPGNELRVHDAINRLAKMGAEVLHEDNAPVHVSGHGKAEELRTMIGLLRPKAVMPVHGEFRMLAAHAQLAREGGVPDDRIVMAENGSVVELRDGVTRIVGEVEAGMTFVDGLGVGDVHDVALRDRRKLSEDGILIVVATLAAQDGGGLTAPPELIARGFGEGAEPLLEELREEANRVLRELLADDVTEIKLLQEHLHDALGGIVYDRTRRRPMVLPVIVEV